MGSALYVCIQTSAMVSINHSKMICISLLIWHSVLSFAVRADFVTDNLPGEWKENADERKNLGEFLSAVGLGFFERLAVGLVSFSNEQIITFDEAGQSFSVKTISNYKHHIQIIIYCKFSTWLVIVPIN